MVPTLTIWNIWLDFKYVSFWAYKFCKETRDEGSVRKYITDPIAAFLYKQFISNDNERINEIADGRFSQARRIL